MKKLLAICLTAILVLVFYTYSFADDKKEFYLSEFKEYINDQSPFDITEYIGQNLIVSFWTTWCPYCVTEMSDFIKFQEDYKDNVRILMIHVADRETFDVAKNFFEKNGYTNKLELLSDNGFYAQAFGVRGFPTNIIFNKEGKLISYGYGTNYHSLKSIFEQHNLFNNAGEEN